MMDHMSSLEKSSQVEFCEVKKTGSPEEPPAKEVRPVQLRTVMKRWVDETHRGGQSKSEISTDSSAR